MNIPVLPVGSATGAKQDTGNSSLADIDAKLGSSLPLPTGAATDATLLTVKTAVTALTKPTDTQAVSAAALPLPAGAATEASLGTDGAAPPSIPGTGIRGWLRSIYDALKATLNVSVTNFPVTQPVSGAVTANAGTNLNTSALALENGNLAAAKVDLDTIASATSGGVNQDNVKNWGGTAVTAPPASGVPASGTEVAPVVKALLRKNQDLVSTANIAASATFASAWFDSQQTGAVQAILSVMFPSAGFGSNALRLDTTDDTTQTVFTTQFFTPPSVTFTQFLANLNGRYWRVRFVNGTTQQTVPLIAVTTVAAARSLNPAMGGNFNDGLLQLMTSGSVIDGAVAGFATNVNNGQGAALVTAQYVVTGGPTTGANWNALRTPVVFKTAKATATGTTAIWTPTLGKKFRLMRFKIIVTANSAQTTAGVVDFDLQDSGTSLNVTHSVFIPATALTTNISFGYESEWIDLGNGQLSAAANNVLNLVFAATGFTGAVRVIACGTEE